MGILDVDLCCDANAILEYTNKIIVPGTGTPYCDPEYTLETIYVQMSVEQTRSYREMEQPGSDADLVYFRGRLVTPEHWKNIRPFQNTYCFRYQAAPFVDMCGIARVLPEVSSRLGLETVFCTHVQLEVRIDNTMFTTNEL